MARPLRLANAVTTRLCSPLSFWYASCINKEVSISELSIFDKSHKHLRPPNRRVPLNMFTKREDFATRTKMCGQEITSIVWIRNTFRHSWQHSHQSLEIIRKFVKKLLRFTSVAFCLWPPAQVLRSLSWHWLCALNCMASKMQNESTRR